MNNKHRNFSFIMAVGIVLFIIAPTITRAQRATNDATIRILVFDEFDIPNDIFYPPRDVYGQGELCAANPEALAGQGRLGVITGMGYTDDLSHGQVVSSIILKTLESFGGVNLGSHTLGYDVMVGNAVIRVEEVDIFNDDSITLDQIVTLIQDTVQYTDIPTVLNMSFAFVPCEMLYDEDEMIDYSEIEDYFSSNAISDDNPFSSIIAEQGNVILVASAGNYRVTYPLYPAGYPWVVSVGANDIDYFNIGEVAHEASWEMQVTRTEKIIGEGTSFSAPRATATIGIYLQNGYPTRCDNGNVPLNFQDSIPPNGIHWDNTDLSLLYIDVSDYCP